MLIREGSVVVADGGFARGGDVVVLAPDAELHLAPEGAVSIATLSIDLDLLSDLVHWQFAGRFAARADARRFLCARYPRPFCVVRLGEDWMVTATRWIDDLVALSREDATATRFYRATMNLCALLDACVDLLQAEDARRPSAVGLSSGAWRRRPRRNANAPLRGEARTIHEAMSRDLAKRWPLTALSEMVHLSPSQVRRVMIASYGKTPLAYLSRLRAEEVARLIRSTDLPLAAAYRRVGWMNRGHAVRTFTQVIGITPQQYAAHHRQRY